MRLGSRGETGSNVEGAARDYLGAVVEGVGGVALGGVAVGGVAVGGVAVGGVAVGGGTLGEAAVAEGAGAVAAGAPAAGGVAEASGPGRAAPNFSNTSCCTSFFSWSCKP